MSYNLKKDISWKFDPYHIISEQRKNVGLHVYQHCPNTAIEMTANKNTWQEVQNVLIMHNSIIKTKMKKELQAKVAVTARTKIHSIDPECIIMGEKWLANINELKTNLSSMTVGETEVDIPEAEGN
jgi:hypothetical protein